MWTCGDNGGRHICAGGASRRLARVVQEGLTNSLRHAGPVPTRVTVAVAHDQLQVRVQNLGAPQFTEESPRCAASPGHGLRGMPERIEGVGGHLLAQPDPAGGFTVAADLPVAAVTQ